MNGTTTDGDTVFDFDILGSDCDDADANILGQTMMLMDTLHALMTATITIHRSMKVRLKRTMVSTKIVTMLRLRPRYGWG